ncbi:MAG TPA: Uma2 family endonuclease [Tepidisphaeraceae bacterium]|nr:Uma2 family endonuclease [Tepidisphaeraceae bacterium]
MSTAPANPLPTPARRAPVPPLENGDHLSRPEFERRFDSTAGLKKAELIEGVVYMPPPVSHDGHSRPHFNVIGLLSAYTLATPGVEGGDNGSLRLDLDNMPQPDVYLLIPPGLGGQARVDADGYVEGAPEFVLEIAATSASMDLHHKLAIYRRSGVREYVVWRTLEDRVDYFALVDGEYRPVPPAATGEHRSLVLPGLWLDAAAVVRGDWVAAARTMQAGLASAEHAAFVGDLQKRAAAAPRP